MAERCFTRAPPGLVKQSEVFEEELEEVVIAVRDGDVDAVEGFLDTGHDGQTLLRLACFYNQPAVAKLVLQLGGFVDVEALKIATVQRHLTLVRLLLNSGVDLEVVDAFKGFLDAGLDVSAPQDTDGWTLLFHACFQPAMAELLLQRGAVVDFESLNAAAMLCRPALVRLLLDPKWDVDDDVVDAALINVERMTDGKIHEGPISPSEPKASDVLLAFREAGFCREKGFVLFRSAMEFTQAGAPPTVVEMCPPLRERGYGVSSV